MNDIWLSAILRDSWLKDSTITIGFMIQKNADQGRCTLSKGELASRSGYSMSAVENAVHLLKRRGYLKVTQGVGRGRTNTYFLVMPKRAQVRV